MISFDMSAVTHGSYSSVLQYWIGLNQCMVEAVGLVVSVVWLNPWTWPAC